jgi:transposase
MKPGRPLRIAWRRGDSARMLWRRFRAEREPLARLRLQFLWRVRCGESIAAAATQVGVTDRAGRAWIRTYRTGGVAALGRPRAHRGGSGSKLTPAQWDLLRTHLATGTCRTAQQVVTWLQTTFGVTYARKSLYKALHRRRVRLKVPRPRHEKSDRAAQDAWKKGGLPLPSRPR